MKKHLYTILLILAGLTLGWTLGDGAYRNTGWWMRILLLTLLIMFIFVKKRKMKRQELESKYQQQEVQHGV